MKFTLNLRDFLRGALLAVLTPVLTIVLQSLNAGSLTFDWKAITITAVSAFLAYITKNFLTDDIRQAQGTLDKAKEKGQL